MRSQIYGVGTDICDIRRIQKAFDKHGERFIHRVLHLNEQRVFQARSNRHLERGIRFLATRFSAKEAFSKSIGLGIHLPMRWSECEIANIQSGQPAIVLHGGLLNWCNAKNLQFNISLSDESDYACSFVVAEIARHTDLGNI